MTLAANSLLVYWSMA